jgi:hypothetical protein
MEEELRHEKESNLRHAFSYEAKTVNDSGYTNLQAGQAC